jgi:lipopolysaccharide export system permease protein
LQLARPVLVMGAACALLCYMLALYIMPLANKHFQDIRTFFRDKYASVLLEEEVFNSPITGLTVFVRQRDEDNTLHGVLLHDNRDPAQSITMIADRGRMEQTSTGPRFYLENGMRQQWKDGIVSWLTFDDYAIDIAFFAKDIARKRDPDERTINELFNPEGVTEKEAAAMLAEAHYRLTWPALTLLLPFMSAAFLFSGEFNRRGQWRRIISASVAILGVVLVFFAMRSLMVKQPALIPGLYLMLAGVASIAWYSLAGGRFRRRRVMTMPLSENAA